MQKVFTKEFMLSNRGCYSISRLMACSFMQKETVLLEDILTSEISLNDKFWFVRYILLSATQNQYLAIGIAEILLEQLNSGKELWDMLQASKDYVNNKINMEILHEKKEAVCLATKLDTPYSNDRLIAIYLCEASSFPNNAHLYAGALLVRAEEIVSNEVLRPVLLHFLINFVEEIPAT